MPAVHDDHRTGPPALGGIHQTSFFSGIILKSLHRRGMRSDDRHDPLGCDPVSKSNIDQFLRHNNIMGNPRRKSFCFNNQPANSRHCFPVSSPAYPLTFSFLIFVVGAAPRGCPWLTRVTIPQNIHPRAGTGACPYIFLTFLPLFHILDLLPDLFDL